MTHTLRCDMCGKPLKARRYQITTLMRPDRTLTVGPDCFRKEKKARTEFEANHTPQEIEAIKARIAAASQNQ